MRVPPSLRQASQDQGVPPEIGFREYKARTRTAIRAVLASTQDGRLNEAAFPAYSHSNPFINWLFWQRVHVVMSFLRARKNLSRVLDFGCGGGVMIPFLSGLSDEVIAADIDLMPLRLMSRHLPLPSNVRVVDLATQSLDVFRGSRGLDLILALDVLEHVPDLECTLDQLLKLLEPGGCLVVSAPTETLVYQLGRRLAGPEYSGAYHHRGAAEIKRAASSRALLRQIRRLYSPIVLFEVFALFRDPARPA